MAPNESSSSPSDNPNPTAVPNCGLLLSSAKFDPFLLPPFLSKKPNFVPPNLLLIGDHVRSSIFSAADKYSVAGLVVANGIINFLNIYNTVLIVRLVLTWFPNAPPSIVSPLSTICDPYLNIFRGIIPPLGGTLDLSPILAFLVLSAFTSTAAALPAELPAAESNRQISTSSFSDLTSSQKKWMRRLHAGNGSKSSHDGQ
ncbi:hypothetical protein TIFTF001_032387 [Ficus carica]|uniref:Uncharacterized protein n=1 Tax=Ficus carica TaxID=3494 RepID=A0AA88DWI4_FICCA|nr:hypothetical protein TIFTF001_032387 [Ficus carica]